MFKRYVALSLKSLVKIKVSPELLDENDILILIGGDEPEKTTRVTYGT